jgi:hypothetical protein
MCFGFSSFFQPAPLAQQLPASVAAQQFSDDLGAAMQAQFMAAAPKLTEQKQDIKQSDASLQRLLLARRRKTTTAEDRTRLFQVIADHLYPSVSAASQNKDLILHCHCLPDGLGDVGQTLLFADIVKEERPDCNVTIVIEAAGSDLQRKISNVFPLNKYKVVFAHQFDGQIKKIDGYPLGVAVSATLSVLEKLPRPPFARTLREYGFAFHCDTKEDWLSLGLRDNEEGINFPRIQIRAWERIQSPWLKNIIDPKRKIYCQYLPTSFYKLTAIYAVVAIESKNEQSIDIFMPIECSLKELLDRGVLDADLLKRDGIGRVASVRQADEVSVATESLPIRNGVGKELRIISGKIPKVDMEIIQQKAEAFYGCTGDMSLSEGLALNKAIFYDMPNHKFRLLPSLIDVAHEMKFVRVENFLKVLQIFNTKEMETAEKTENFKLRKRVGGGMFGAWLDAILDIFDKNFGGLKSDYTITPQDNNAVAHCLKGITQAAVQFAAELVGVYQDPLFMQEMQAFAKYIRENYNAKSRLLANVDRGVFLQNHPDVFEIEKGLRGNFIAGKVTQDAVIKELFVAIQSALTPPANISLACRK